MTFFAVIVTRGLALTNVMSRANETALGALPPRVNFLKGSLILFTCDRILAMIRVDATDGRVRLRNGQGAIWLDPCRAAAVQVDGKRWEMSDDAVPESGVDGLVVRQRWRGGPELRWHFQPREGALVSWLEVHNASDDPLELATLEVLAAPLEGEADVLVIGFASPGAPDTAISMSGGKLLAIAHLPGTPLPPGGTLPSELLFLALDHPRGRELFEQEVARESGV
jgi:hypothetical protein